MTNRPEPATPPAASGLPNGVLDSAVRGASALDVQAFTPYGHNLLAHALVQLRRDGWLAEPTQTEDEAIEAEPACRVCGCTEDQPCEGGCHWVEDPQMGDLCSRCEGAALKVAVVDLVGGESETIIVQRGDCLLTTTEPCYRHHVQVAGSTHVVTIKGVRHG